jgi:flagellar protein FliL
VTDAALAPPLPARSVKATLMEFAFVLLIGAGVGAAFETTRPAPAPAAKPGDAPKTALQPSTVLDLAPIVTNLGAPPDIWVRIEASIVVDPAILPHPEGVAAKIGDDILAYARTLSLKQLEGPIGLESLRQDLNERAATRSDGKVREVFIRTLVVQ